MFVLRANLWKVGFVFVVMLLFIAPALYAAEKEGGMLFGSAEAPITLIEYASLSCGHCGRFHREVFPKLKKTYLDTGIAKLYIRDFPHNDVGILATIVLRCAAPETRPKFYDLLIQNQSKWFNRSDARVPLRQYATLAGINATRIEACFQDKVAVKKLFADVELAKKEWNVISVPTLFVEGKKVKADFKALSRAIEAAQ